MVTPMLLLAVLVILVITQQTNIKIEVQKCKVLYIKMCDVKLGKTKKKESPKGKKISKPPVCTIKHSPQVAYFT